MPHSGLCLLVRQKNELKTHHIFREHILIILILVLLFILYRSHQDDSAYHQNQESIRYKDYKPQRYTFDIELLSEQPKAIFCISGDPKSTQTHLYNTSLHTGIIQNRTSASWVQTKLPYCQTVHSDESSCITPLMLVADAHSVSEHSQQNQVRRMRQRTSPRWWRRRFSPPPSLLFLLPPTGGAPIESWIWCVYYLV